MAMLTNTTTTDRSLLSMLGVKPAERTRMRMLMFNALLAGLTYIFLYTSTYAIFLDELGSDFLAYLYIVNGLILSVIGIAFERLNRRISLTRLIVYLQVALLVGTILVYGLSLSGYSPSVMAFVALTWTGVVWLTSNFQLWELAGRLLDMQESKRLFPLVSAGAVLGIITGGLLTPVILSFVDIFHLILIASGFLLLSAFYLGRQLPAFDAQLHGQSDSNDLSGRKSLSDLLRQKYVRGLFLYQIGIVTLYYMVDFIFYVSVEARFQERESIASFNSVFFAITTVLIVVISLTVAGRILNRYGVRFGLSANSSITALLLLPLLFIGENAPMFFWLVVGLRMIHEIADRTVGDPAQQLLYKPLPEQERVQTRVAVESVVKSVAISGIGVVLLIFQTLQFSGIPQLSVVLLALAGAVVLLVRVLSRMFVSQISNAIRVFALTDFDQLIMDADMVESLSDLIHQHENPVKALYALRVISQSLDGEVTGPYATPLKALLIESIRHPSAVVRREAIQILVSSDIADDAVYAHLKAWFPNEEDATNKGLLLQAIIQFGRHEDLPLARDFLSSDNLQRDAIAVLLRYGTINDMIASGQRITDLSDSPDPQHRILAGQILGELGTARNHDLILKLLKDEDIEVQKSILDAIRKIKSPVFWGYAINKLNSPRLWRDALECVVAGGVSVLPQLHTWQMQQQSDYSQRTYVRILSQIKSPETQAILFEMLHTADRPSAHIDEILMGLQRQGFLVRTDEERSVVEKSILNECQEVAYLLGFIGSSTNLANSRTLLTSVVQDQIRQSQQRVALLASFWHPNLSGTPFIFANQNVTRLSFAIELLETHLPNSLKTPVETVLSHNLSFAEKHTVLRRFVSGEPASSQAYVEEMICQKHAFISPLLASTAIYCGDAFFDSSDAFLELLSGIDSDNPLIRQTVDHKRAQLNQGYFADDNKPKEEFMLTTLERLVVLEQSDIFREVPYEYLLKVADVMKITMLRSGETLFHKGDFGDAMYIIVDGEIEVHDSGQTLATLSDNAILGEMSLLDDEARIASATAVSDCHLLQLQREAFELLIYDHPIILKGIATTLSRRLRASNIQHVKR